MVCIYCSGETQVVNSRLQKKSNQVWRRRRCLTCQAVFTTTEGTTLENNLVINHKGRVEPFSRDTLFISVYDSLKHRKTAVADATALTATVWAKLLPHITNASLDKAVITETSLEVLRRFDKAAATSYQAFHPI